LAEILEYSLVLLATTLVLVFSLVTYQSFSATVASAEFRAQLVRVMAKRAVQDLLG